MRDCEIARGRQELRRGRPNCRRSYEHGVQQPPLRRPTYRSPRRTVRALRRRLRTHPRLTRTLGRGRVRRHDTGADRSHDHRKAAQDGVRGNHPPSAAPCAHSIGCCGAHVRAARERRGQGEAAGAGHHSHRESGSVRLQLLQRRGTICDHKTATLWFIMRMLTWKCFACIAGSCSTPSAP